MGLSYYPEFEKPIAGVDVTSVDGKSLAHALDELTKIARRHNVRPLADFVSVGSDQIEQLIDEEIPDLGAADWYESGEALATVIELKKSLEANPKQFFGGDAVLIDLTNLEKTLALATAEGTRFRLSVDF